MDSTIADSTNVASTTTTVDAAVKMERTDMDSTSMNTTTTTSDIPIKVEPTNMDATTTTVDAIVKMERTDMDSTSTNTTTTTSDVPIKVEPTDMDSTNMDATTTIADVAIKLEPTGVRPTDVDSTTATTDTAIKLEPNTKTVRILNMGDDQDTRFKQIQKQCRGIVILCKNTSGPNGIPPHRADEMRQRFADAHLFLDWLDTNVEMTPRIKSAGGVGLVLDRLMDPKNNVPGHMVNKALALFKRYEAENWGQDAVADEETDGDNQSLVPSTPIPQATPTTSPTIVNIQLPSDDDPIFGIGGIMYGIVVDTSGRRRDYRLRPDLPRPSAKVYGNNNIALGSWFPFQINALFWGAHGARMGGIAGSVSTGAWSIVIASTYEDLDSDYGDTLYYSGSNSHGNENPRQAAPASQGTKALHASLATQNPVRVLRSGGASSASNRNPHLPSCGLRYDGLYRVALYRQRINGKGGLYDQFKLERLPGQTPLSELQRNSPTTEQIFARDRLRGGN
ncbi:PUA-like domain-containing protein [Xylariaceae sp. AK1471]|nr:PUA-like domain-containing protein [Xylariaceae sp. AK1471]